MADQGSERVERTETYTAARLHASDIPGTVEVRVGEGDAMQVRITGPETLVERIRREARGDVLHISGPKIGGGGMTIVSHGRGVAQTNVFGGVITSGDFVVGGGGGGVFISGGNVVVRGGRVVSGDDGVTHIESEEVRIVVDVPRQTPITIDGGFVGSYTIGDTEGPLDLRMDGGDVTVGRVGDTRVAIQGSSDVEISEVTSRALNVAIQGSGDVTVRKGQVDTLDIEVQGSSDVVYGGTARRAHLSLTGSGDIRVNEVTESLDDRSTGSGRIRVHVPPRRDPGSFWS